MLRIAMHLLRCAVFIGVLLLLNNCDKELSTTQPNMDIYNGKILFDSNPQGAAIFLNGDNTGKFTPDSILHLEGGSYCFTFKYDPYFDIIDSTVLPAEQRMNVFKDFYSDERNFGYIFCNSTPENALIFLNDSCTNKYTPDTLNFIWPGSYRVTCTYPEHRAASKIVYISGKQSKSINIELQDTTDCVDYSKYNSLFATTDVTCLVIDKNNCKWAGTAGDGIINFTETSTTTYTSANSQLQSQNISSIITDNFGNVWAGTRKGVIKIDQNGNLSCYTCENSDMPQDFVNAIVFDHDNNLWIGAGNPITEKILIKYDGTQWTSYPSDKMIMALTVDRKNRIWVGQDVGFKIFDNGNWVDITESLSPDHHLKVHPIESLLEDNEGTMWIGAAPVQIGGGFFKGGLYRSVDDIIEYFIAPERLISNISLDGNGNKWISVYGFHTSFHITSWSAVVLMRIDINNNIHSYKLDSRYFPTSKFTCSAADDYGNLWLGTYGFGLIKFKTAYRE